MIWLKNKDKRGGEVGVVMRGDKTEHPRCIDIVAKVSTGHCVLVRLEQTGVNELIEALEAARNGKADTTASP